MKVESVLTTDHGETLKLHAVYGKAVNGCDEDNTYARLTPSASLEMEITNPALFGEVKPSDMFYVYFTKIEK